MKRESYYIPVLIYGSLLEKRGQAIQSGHKPAPLYRAYIHLLQTGLERMKTDWEFDCAVLSNWTRVDPKDSSCWQKVTPPIPADLHAAVKKAAEENDRRLYDFCHALFTEGEKSFQFSDIKTAQPCTPVF